MNLPSRRLLVITGLTATKSDWEQALVAAGFPVVEFTDPESAMTVLRHGSFELAVLDETLADGFSAATLAVEIRDQLGIPVAFAGRAEDPAAFHRLREADPFAFIAIPWTAALLRAQLELALHRLDQERERARMLPGRLLAHERLEGLEAMLPICASCKKISSHEGRWVKLEEYFTKQARVHFTHSFCPDCEQRLYGAHATRPPHATRD
ncbi:hypothetical protein [Nibricoccus sp. IMCC34717]|uniref:hypothetical protein n=1 Tax=Nibricoccus sp. IMCC34717 TaxID=3034021 RepID=UPI00384F9921